MARLILICGLPGSGKTTLARQLAADRAAVRLAPDEWLTALGLDHWDDDTRERLERQFWHFAQDLLRLGLDVILESGFWSRSDRNEKRTGARDLGAAVELHYLDVREDELWRRIEDRNSQSPWNGYPIQRSDLTSWLPLFEPPSREEQSLFDPSPR